MLCKEQNNTAAKRHFPGPLHFAGDARPGSNPQLLGLSADRPSAKPSAALAPEPPLTCFELGAAAKPDTQLSGDGTSSQTPPPSLLLPLPNLPWGHPSPQGLRIRKPIPNRPQETQ